MRHFIAVLALALPMAAAADDGWVPLTGAEIADALSGQTLKYETARQTFYASGRTLYDAGRPSWGYWQVRGDAYCSMWPPSDIWACYHMDRRAGMLRFVGGAGDITVAEVQPTEE